jgi:hypothetical protein
VRGLDRAAVGEPDDDAVAGAVDAGCAATAHPHAPALEDRLQQLGGVMVLPRQHTVSAGDQRDRQPIAR